MAVLNTNPVLYFEIYVGWKKKSLARKNLNDIDGFMFAYLIW